MATERVIIQKGATDALVGELKTLFQRVKAGDPLSDPSVAIGALFTESSAENVITMNKEAVEAGAQVLLGDLSREGSIVQPHIVAGVRPGMRLWDRESFGPGTAPPYCRRAPLTGYGSPLDHSRGACHCRNN